MRHEGQTSKTLRARELGVSRGTIYYQPKKPEKDWRLKAQIEEVLRKHPSYGSPRIALELKRNHKPIERVMKIFGIKAYRRRGKRWKKTKKIKVIYPNLLLTEYPSYPNHIWVSDFTYIPFQGKTVYLATVMDLFTRRIVGLSVMATHAVQLVMSAFMSALHNNPRHRSYSILTTAANTIRKFLLKPWKLSEYPFPVPHQVALGKTVIRNRSMINLKST